MQPTKSRASKKLRSKSSNDGITYTQANEFATKFNMLDLRLYDGYWYADDDDYAYPISKDNYWGAKNSGDLD